ncbi:MAG: hypothetical protein RSE00_04605 [Clostridia bacterium]
MYHFGYERADIVEGKGQFAIRGAIIDIFTVDGDFPFRIELFGDVIDSIRTFDVVSQRSIDILKEIKISYIKEGYIIKESIDNAIKKLKKICDKDEISPTLRNNLLQDIEKIENGILENLLDKYFGLFVDKSETLLDYVSDYTIFFDEVSKSVQKAHNLVYENTEQIKSLVSREYIYPSFVNSYISIEEVLAKSEKYTNIYLENLTFDTKIHEKRQVISYNTKELNFYQRRIRSLTYRYYKAKAKSNFTYFSNYKKSRTNKKLFNR